MRAIQKIALLVCLIVAGTVSVAEEDVQLEGITIHGNRELPKSLVIVPWKASELGELSNRSLQSLIDDVLTPVDRDVFHREQNYYEAVHAGE